MKLRLLINESTELPAVYEEALFMSRALDKCEDTLWIWKHPKVVHLNKIGSLEFLDAEYLNEIKAEYPVSRGNVFSSSPQSIIVAGNDVGILSYSKNMNYLQLSEFITNFWIYTLKGLLEMNLIGNDLTVNGTKIYGFIRGQKGLTAGTHAVFSETQPEVDFNRLYKRDMVKLITSYQQQTGNIFDYKWLQDKFIEYCGTLDIEVELGDFNEYENAMIQQLIPKHSDEEWINNAVPYISTSSSKNVNLLIADTLSLDDTIIDLVVQSPIAFDNKDNTNKPLAMKLGLGYSNFSYNSNFNLYSGHIILERYLITQEFLDKLSQNNLVILNPEVL